ncbi:MAG: hypothetical protein R3314_01965 [Longimicrobiales bacterium]|nr:hypothetical protein [Longimicrobiales bacterium]
MGQGPTIVALVMDLMFASRVRGAAPEAVIARSPAALLEAVGPGTRLVLVDLQARDALEALEGLRDRPSEVRVVAWGPHVMEEALAAAREAGADEVLPRGAFVRQLPQLVAAVET